MKHLLTIFLIYFITTSLSNNVPLWTFSGDMFYGTSGLSLPTIQGGNPATCVAGTDNTYNYANVTFTPNTTGIYLIEGLRRTAVQYQVYKGSFSAASPCTNALFFQQNGNNILDKTTLYDYFYDNAHVVPLTGGQVYVIVVSGQSQSTLNGFAFQISLNDGAGSTTTSTNLWMPAYRGGGGSGTCTAAAQTTAFDTFTFTPSVTGTWDFILAQYANATSTFTMSAMYFAIYNTSVTASQLNTSSCQSSWFEGGFATSTNAGLYYNLPVVKGTTYTIVVSGFTDTTDNGMYAYWMRLTPTYTFTNNPAFQQPSNLQPIFPCSNGTNSGAWLAVSVKAMGDRLLTKWKSLTAATEYVYAGSNVGSASTAPTACPSNGNFVATAYVANAGLDTNSTVGVTYTVILSPYSGGNSNDYAILLTLTGKTIIGPDYNGDASSSGYTTSSTASGTTSSTASGTKSSSTSSKGTTTTSGIEALFVSIILLVVVLLF